MLASGKHSQHARCVSGIGGLAEKLAINLATNDNHSVGSEHDIMRTLTGNRERLLAPQAFGTCPRGLSRQWVFGDMRGLHFECDPSVA
jgi:hypothetical protein